MSSNFLAFIGGSGLYKISNLEVIEEISLKTPFGEPSSPIIRARYKDYDIFFLSRHGIGHKFPPHKVPYRANIWALRELGVNKIIGINAVGGINRSLKPGDFGIVSQFIDFTKSRPSSFYEGIYSVDIQISDENLPKWKKLILEKKVVHIDITEPFCPTLRKVIKEVLKEKGYSFMDDITYVATEGPRLETKAEIKMFSLLGGDVVGMTMVPEVVLANELEMHYAGICVITNLAAGISETKLTSEEVIEMMHQREKDLKEIIISLIEKVYSLKTKDFNCLCENRLEGAPI
jgi:5'-methylthioadenosine phosphorylase